MNRIEKVAATLVRVPLPRPVAWANVKLDSREYVVVRIDSSEGESGTGFAVGSRFLGGGRVIKTIVDEVLAPVALGRDPREIRTLWEEMHFQALLLGRNGAVMRALSAVDIALWDALARTADLRLCDLLGRSREAVPAYASGGYYYHDGDFEAELEHLREEVATARERGFEAVKIKIGRLSPQQDARRVEAVLGELGEGVRVAVDANHAWRDAASAVNALRHLDDLGLWWIEEPVLPDAVDASAWLASKLTTPIATGEVEAGLPGFKRLVDARAATVLQADVTVVGGITEWMRIAALAESADLCLAPHWVPEIHVQLGAALTSVVTLEYFHESVGVLNFDRLVSNPLAVVDGMARVPACPGHGIDWDLDAIARYEVN